MEFNLIKNKICTFTYDSLVQQLLSILKHQESQAQITPFWYPLVLLKWTIEFAGRKQNLKVAQPKDIRKLLGMMDETQMSHRIFNPRQSGKLSKTFAILAFQQFLYQENAYLDSFVRQYLLFTQLKSKYDIELSFKKKTGIDIEVLLQFFLILCMFILNDVTPTYRYRGYIDKDFMEIAQHLFKEDDLRNIIQLLSISRSNFKNAIQEDTRQVKNYNLQLFDVSFFTRKPFFHYGNIIYIPHKLILNQTCNYFIYDYLKGRDENFTTELGLRMEKYMKLGLEEAAMSFVTENDLRKRFGKTHTVVDFLIDDCILVEAKAIELKPHVSVNPEDHLLSQELRQNIGKAYATQMLGIANKLDSGEECFGIIVTYKQLYIGDSGDMWEQFLEKETTSLLNNQLEAMSVLPIENLFIMDLDTWDLLMQVLKENTVSLSELLKKVREDDAQPQTKLFFFSMHLKKYGVKKLTHKYLEQARAHVQAWNINGL